MNQRLNPNFHQNFVIMIVQQLSTALAVEYETKSLIIRILSAISTDMTWKPLKQAYSYVTVHLQNLLNTTITMSSPVIFKSSKNSFERANPENYR